MLYEVITDLEGIGGRAVGIGGIGQFRKHVVAGILPPVGHVLVKIGPHQHQRVVLVDGILRVEAARPGAGGDRVHEDFPVRVWDTQQVGDDQGHEGRRDLV